MKSRNIGYMFIRILSIIFCLKGFSETIQTIASSVGMNKELFNMQFHILSITSRSVYLIVGILLWLYAHKLVNKIIIDTDDKTDNENDIEVFNSDLYAVAISVTGLVISLNSIAFIYQTISLAFITAEEGQVLNAIGKMAISNLGGKIIILIISLILLFRPRILMKHTKIKG